MPYGSYLLIPPQRKTLSALLAHPQFSTRLHTFPRRLSPNLPRRGIVMADLCFLNTSPLHRNPEENENPWAPWLEDLKRLNLPTAETTFDPENLEERFHFLHRYLPPREMLAFFKATAFQTRTQIVWYTWHERGDFLYHDAAWFFGPSGDVELAPNVTFTPRFQDEDELFVVYEGDGHNRGWLLWDNARKDSTWHDQPALERVCLHMGFEGTPWNFLDRLWRVVPAGKFRYLHTFNERMEKLRELLHQEPSSDAWNDLCTLMEHWPASQNFNLALEYARKELNTSWPPELRIAPARWKPSHPCSTMANST